MGFISTSQTIVLVTGANQGLGFQTIKKLAAEQANYTLLLASRNHFKGVKAAESITKLAPSTSVVPIELEVTSDDSIAKAVDKVSSSYGKLDVLFNNAGISSAPNSTPRENWAKVLDVNVASTSFVTEAFVPLLKKAALPRVVFMSTGLASLAESLNPDSPYHGILTGAYGVSKTAMNMVAIQIAIKYKNEGFKINVVDPGYNQTNLNAYNQYANPNIEDGAVESCRIITQGKNGQYSTFTAKEGAVKW